MRVPQFPVRVVAVAERILKYPMRRLPLVFPFLSTLAVFQAMIRILAAQIAQHPHCVQREACLAAESTEDPEGQHLKGLVSSSTVAGQAPTGTVSIPAAVGEGRQGCMVTGGMDNRAGRAAEEPEMPVSAVLATPEARSTTQFTDPVAAATADTAIITPAGEAGTVVA